MGRLMKTAGTALAGRPRPPPRYRPSSPSRRRAGVQAESDDRHEAGCNGDGETRRPGAPRHGGQTPRGRGAPDGRNGWQGSHRRGGTRRARTRGGAQCASGERRWSRPGAGKRHKWRQQQPLARGLIASPARIRWCVDGRDVAPWPRWTRADLTDAVHKEIGLPRRDAKALVDTVIETIAERLEAGEVVKISSFGSFTVRDKGLRVGRNPKTGRAGADPAAPGRRVPRFGGSEAAYQRRDGGRR